MQNNRVLAEKENIQYFANGGDRKNIDQIPEANVCDNHNIEMIFNSGGGKISYCCRNSWNHKLCLF